MNRKGIELGINFLVVLILSIVIFVGGITIFFKAFGQSKEQAAYMDQATQRQIEAALDDGRLVAIPMSSKTVDRGGKVDFGVAVSNELGEARDFSISIGYATGDPEYDANAFTVVFDSTAVHLENNDRHVFPVRFVPKTKKKGAHVFSVYVCYEGSGTPVCGAGGFGATNTLYDSVQKIYLTVR